MSCSVTAHIPTRPPSSPPALTAARAAGAATVAVLIGTAGDPQGLDRQARALVDAGAIVHRSNARAAEEAAALAIGAGAGPVGIRSSRP